MQGILVTGANGFLGRAVVEKLQQAGIVVRGTGRSAPRDLSCDYRVLDLTIDGKYPDDLMQGIDVVIHCAGLAHQFGPQTLTAEDYHRVNTIGTRRLLDAAVKAGVSHFVLISSVSVYGSPGDPLCDESTECRPATHYATSKLAAEEVCIRAADKQNIAVTCLRMTTIYGAGDPGNTARLLRMLRSKRMFWQIGHGLNRKSIIHVRDAAEACLRAAIVDCSPGSVRIFNVADEPRLMGDILSTAGKITVTRLSPLVLPPALLMFVARGLHILCLGRGPFERVRETIQKWIRHDAYDGRAFQQSHNFEPEVSLEDGLREEVAWLRKTPSTRNMSHLSKRMFDVCASGILLLLLAPIMLLVAIAVRLTSSGPALYVAQRVGKNNRHFRMFKFRSMKTQTPQIATNLLKDSRGWMTPIGNFLRSTSLDELPQLWNVLKGDMSLVGPRPALFNEDELNSLRTFRGVHQLLPGITGWAQISGRDEIPPVVKVEFDVAYMKRQSFWFDLKILFLTVLRVVKRDGIRQPEDAVSTNQQTLCVREGTDVTLATTPDQLTLTACAADLLERQGLSIQVKCQTSNGAEPQMILVKKQNTQQSVAPPTVGYDSHEFDHAVGQLAQAIVKSQSPPFSNERQSVAQR